MKRVTLYYSGRVQGVGFRYTVYQIARGYDITGAVRNLHDGRVEVIAQGDESELRSFIEGIKESHLEPFIRETCEVWEEARDKLQGFQIAD